MKYFVGLTVLKYSWDQVATGFWSRYPNPYRSVLCWLLISSTVSQCELNKLMHLEFDFSPR